MQKAHSLDCIGNGRNPENSYYCVCNDTRSLFLLKSDNVPLALLGFHLP